MKIGTFETHPAADWFPLLEGDEFDALVNDVRENGLRVPIVRQGDKVILDGRNRLRACLKANVKPQFSAFDGRDPIAFIISTNLHRRHLNESQRAIVAAKLANLPNGRRPSPIGEGGSTQATAAAMLNVGKRSVERARVVLEHAAPQVVKAVERGAMTVSAAAELARLPKQQQKAIAERVERDEEGRGARPGFVRALVRKEQRVELAKKINAAECSSPMPLGPYRVIVADPPWDYTKRDGDATHRMISYPSMPTDAICRLGDDVGKLVHPDGCILWLWTTNAFMRDAYRVLDAWGFAEKTILTWDKERMGLGDWLRGQTEHAILAVRGAPPRPALSNETTLIRGGVREHSRKPEQFYALVEKLCPGSKLEMFAREARDGWARWGAEPDKFTAQGAA